ncbi:MAG: hypothetical protein ACKOET_05690, partial [Verrucomicrobiota bacterium]
MLGDTLEPTIGPNGPIPRLRADLTLVAGQYGEGRLGIEGRGFFVVGDLVIVPEASTLAGGCVVGLGRALAGVRKRRGGGPVGGGPSPGLPYREEPGRRRAPRHR